MCYTAALKMPSSYAVMNEEEMTYLEGGSYNVPLSRAYLKKNYCLAEATKLLERQMVSGMTQMQIAQEIYAHAVTKYFFETLPEWVRKMPIAREVYSSAADGAYIDDKGDSDVRQVFYSTVWAVL